jgi:tripartite-type tricarboxylate transporter receptor subunit TctC
MLRKAFDDTLKDPEFLKDAKLQDLNVDAITGQELAEIIASVYKTPKDVVKRTARALGHVSKGNIGN